MTATSDALEPLSFHGGANVDQEARLALAARPLAERREQQLQRALFLLGAFLIPLGLALVVLGYWGAAHATRVIQQVPYELSGGILGLGLVFLGGFAYFAWWLTHLLRDQRQLAQRVDEQTIVLADALGRIEALLGSGAGGGTGSNGRPAARGRAAADVLVTTPTGSLVHRPDCQVVAGRDDTTVVAGSTAGLKPCRICNPAL